MKQIVRYRFLTVPSKLYADIRVTVDDTGHSETRSTYDGGKSITLMLLPMINIQLVKPLEITDDGRRHRPVPSINDSIGLTKFNLPTFISELKGIYEDMKTPDLYVYRGERLDLNDAAAEKIRRAFIVGRSGVELRAVVIEQPTENGGFERLEGIKFKINNEDSTVLLTLREIESMLWTFDHIDVDSLVLMMYTNFIERNAYEYKKPVVDITPVAKTPVPNVPVKPAPVLKPSEITLEEIPFDKAPVFEPSKKKEITQDTVIEIPIEKYKIESEKPVDDFSKYMNPPE